MKLLVTLSVLQTIGIGVLIFLVANSGAPVAQSQAHQTLSPAESNSHATLLLEDSSQLPNEGRLRQVIREELLAQHGGGNPNTASNAKPEVIDPRTTEKLRAQRDLVAQRIEGYKGVGAITESQMDELQSEIADLDDANRKQMMSLLIRAMNAGTIKGHL